MKNQNESKFYGILGLIGAIIVGIGEFCLHYSSKVLENGDAFSFFNSVPLENLTLGHFLAIIGIPFYFVGYIHIYLMLKSGNQNLAKVVLFLGFTAFSVGGVWIGSRAFLGNIIHLKDSLPSVTYQAIIDAYQDLVEILVTLLRIVILLLSILFSVLVLGGHTYYQKWMAIFNPMTILLVLLSTLLIPSVGKFVVPTLMNVTHFVFFSLSLYNLKIYENA